METRAIRDDEEYREVLKEIETRMGACADSKEGERLGTLVKQVGAWERERYALASGSDSLFP